MIDFLLSYFVRMARGVVQVADFTLDKFNPSAGLAGARVSLHAGDSCHIRKVGTHPQVLVAAHQRTQ